MFLVCFSSKGPGQLHRINGIMETDDYIDILKKNLKSTAYLKMPRGLTFQQDNDPKHTPKKTGMVEQE